jgi:hypothetical protein
MDKQTTKLIGYEKERTEEESKDEDVNEEDRKKTETKDFSPHRTDWVHSQVSGGAQSDSGTEFCHGKSVFHCRYHPTAVP